MKKTALSFAVATVLPLMIAGCGGGGGGGGTRSDSSSESSSISTSPAIARTGQVTGLQGVNYATATKSGTTSNTGQFDYVEGEDVTFYVGDIELGTAEGQAEVTISDLAGGNAQMAKNIERFLLTVDYDMSPANGVLITKSIHEAAEGKSLNFNQSEYLFTIEAARTVSPNLASDDHVTVFKHSVANLLPKAYQQKSNRSAQQALAQFTYPQVSAADIDSIPGVQEEAAEVIDLMLQNAVEENGSPLEFILGAMNVPLVVESDETGSLVDMYIEYKQRIARIGRDAPIVDREDFIEAPETPDFVDVQHFVVMSDFQMRDEESPLNVNPVKFLIPSSYYPASAHIAYQVDDMVRTLRDYEAEVNKPIEMAVFTGDFTDISQYNETRLGIDVLDGGMINPDSGADDDPIPGYFEDGKPNDTYDAFEALGLNGQEDGQADIPWYYIAGNHDGLMLGNFPITDEPLNLFGTDVRGGTRELFDNIATGDVNWLGFEPTIIGFITNLFNENWRIAPDEDRRVLNPAEIAHEMFHSSSHPHGHGMQHVIDQQGDLNGKQHYSFESDNGLVRHIALDTNMPLGPEGWLTLNSISWIRAELDQAVANGQLVIVSSHHKPKDIIINGFLLIDILNQYPNVIAHLVAHSHTNAIRARAGDDALHSYWEIESGSMVNWPQQFRTLDIQIDVESGIGVMNSTMLNHSTDSPLHVSNRGRFLSYIERQLEGSFFGDGGLETAEGLDSDRNTRLYFAVPDSVLARL
ncbi:MAG: metallophosphoesterase [Pseudomonadales bacterium]|nr:metallophosphoesterase [Pseudomonadales bacterium]